MGKKWNAEKLADVPGLLDKYKGQEAEIYDKIVRKYVFCQEEKDWRPLLEAFYRRFNPDKLDDITSILDKYKRSEPSLFKALCDKYLPSVEADDDLVDLDVWRQDPYEQPEDEGSEKNQKAHAEPEPAPQRSRKP